MDERVSAGPRVLTVLAAVSLLFALNQPWRAVAPEHPAAGLLLGVCFPLALGCAVVALAAHRPRTLELVAALELAVAFATQLPGVAKALTGRGGSGVDETVLVHRAARAIAAGTDPYRLHWARAVAHAPTLLLNGGVADRYGYPPLSALLGAAVARVLPGSSETTVVAYAALVATGLLAFVLLPAGLRALAVPAVVTVSALPFLAGNGYPLAVATPLLLLATAGWERIGAGGRLGRRATVQAAALGLAAATQQLVWFVVPFLAVALWCVRRGEADARTANRVLGRWAAVAAAAFAVVNLPFLVAGPAAWWSGLLDPLRQHAFFDGPGIAAALSLRLLPGSGALGLYSAASLLLLGCLLLATALFPARLAPAALVLPVLVFWVSMRSQVQYYEAFTAVALVVAVVADRGLLAAARPVPLPRRPGRALLAATAAGVIGCLAVAAATPAPLRVRVVRATVVAPDRIGALWLHVTNTSGATIRPHFTTDRLAKESLYWSVLHGAARLGPRRSATYEIVPPALQRRTIGRPQHLYVVSDAPETLSVGTVPRP